MVGVAFAASKTLQPAADAYRIGLGALQWPVAALVELLGSGSAPELRPVPFVQDASDLVTLPALLVPLGLGWRRGRRHGWRHEADPDSSDQRHHGGDDGKDPEGRIE